MKIGCREVAGEEVVDDPAVVGGCVGEDPVELADSLVDLDRGEGRTGRMRYVRIAVAEPGPPSERRGHRVEPLFALVWVGRWGAESGLCWIDVVKVAPGGDRRGGVVPDGGAGRVGGSGADPPGEPVR